MFERTRRDPSWDKFKGHHKKIALFIDGANFFVSQKVVGLNIDWSRFLSYYGSQGDLLRAFYYTGILPKDRDMIDPLRPVLDWLAYNGFHMRTKPAKKFIDPLTGRETIKGNMDIEIAIDAIDMIPYMTDMFLFSGDGDFTPLVQRIQREGIRVHVVSTIIEKNPMCADNLRRQCDSFHELATLVPHLVRGEE